VHEGGSDTNLPPGFSYQWQYSRDRLVWHDITDPLGVPRSDMDYEPKSSDKVNNNNMDVTPGKFWIQRHATSKMPGSDCSAASNEITITVSPYRYGGSDCAVLVDKEVEDDSQNMKAEAGELLEYTITVRNTWQAPLTEFKLIEELPDGTVYDTSLDAVNLQEGWGWEPGINSYTLNYDDPVGILSKDDKKFKLKLRTAENLTGRPNIINKVVVEGDPLFFPDPGTDPGHEEGYRTIPTNRTAGVDLKKEGKIIKDPDNKDIDKIDKAQAGDIIEYTITLLNKGDVDVKNITVTDTIPGGTAFQSADPDIKPDNSNMLKWTGIDVAHGKSVNLKFRVKVEKDLTNHEHIKNTVNANGIVLPADADNGNTIDEEAKAADLATARKAEMTMLKKVTYAGPYGLDNEIEYEITVENTGNLTLYNILVTDPLADAIAGKTVDDTNPIVELPVGEMRTFTATRTVTQDDVDAGRVDNIAKAFGTDPGGKSVTAESSDPDKNLDRCKDCPDPDPAKPCATCTIVPVEQGDASVKIKKEQIPAGKTDYEVDKEIEYRITVKNDGDLTLKDIVFDDPTADKPSDMSAWKLASLKPGGEWIFTVTHKVTQDSLDAGRVRNTATVSAKNPQDKPVDPATATVVVMLDQNPELEVEKKEISTPPADGYKRGDIVRYEITVTNKGNVTLKDIEVEDLNADGTVPSIPPSLAPDASESIEVSHKVGQADLDAAEVINIATARGYYGPNGDPVDGISNTVKVKVDQGKGGLLEMKKKVTSKSQEPADYKYKRDEKVEYEITVKNTGDLTLYQIYVTDLNADEQPEDKNGGPNPIAALPVGETRTFTVSHTVTQADRDAGRVNNIATAKGKNPQDKDVTAESTDPDAGLRCATCPIAVPPCTGCTTVPVDQGEAKMKLEKEVTSTGPYNEGDKIQYKITVKNSGMLTLKDVTVTDPKADASPKGSWNRTIPTLAVDEERTFSAEYTVTDDDVTAGYVDNLASVKGKDPQGKDVTKDSEDPDCPDCDATTVPVTDPNPVMEMTKKVTNTGPFNEGDKIEYAITVRNTGNVVLKDVKVEDANADVVPGIVGKKGEANPLPALMPEKEVVFVAYHTVTADDVKAGYVNNLATAVGKDPSGGEITDASEDPDCPDCDETTVPIGTPNPNMTVDKAVVSVPADPVVGYTVGERIEYEIKVRNSGNVALKDVTVEDDNADAAPVGKKGEANPIPALMPEQEVVFVVSHTVTQDDIDKGGVLNIATATGETPKDGPMTVKSKDPDENNSKPGDPTVVDIEQRPKMTVVKDADWEKTYLPGDKIEYEIKVRNTGNVTLKNVKVDDDNADLSTTGTDSVGNPVANPIPVLTPGQWVVFTASHTVTQDDIDARYVRNRALAEGEDPNGDKVPETSRPPKDYGDPGDPEYAQDSTVIRVGTIPIVAQDDIFPAWAGRGANTGSVLANDTFDDRPAGQSSRVELVPGTPDDPTLMSMDPDDGSIRLRPGLRPGRYAYPYTILQVDNPSNKDTATAYIDVVDPNRGLHIPNVFTPNNDGINDTFEILGLPNFDRVSLRVFTRYGDEVYVNEDYRNDWDANNPEIQAGTYFYTIDTYKDGHLTEKIRGWVTIMRRNLK